MDDGDIDARIVVALAAAHSAYRASASDIDSPHDRAEHARRAHELAAYAETLMRISRGLREDAAKVAT